MMAVRRRGTDVEVILHRLGKGSTINDQWSILDNKVNMLYARTLGFGKAQYFIMVPCALVMLSVMTEIMGMSIIVVANQCEFHTNKWEKLFITIAAPIGMVISSYYWGRLADNKGRRYVVRSCMFICVLSSLVSAFMPNVFLFIFMRFVIGVFLAGPSLIVSTYLSEFSTLKIRPKLINGMSVFYGIAMLYIPSVAWPCLTNKWHSNVGSGYDIKPWRIVLLFYMLPGFIGVLLLLKCPESPKFLLLVNNAEESWKTLEWICRKNTGKTLKDFHIFRVKAMQVRRPRQEMSVQCPIFQLHYRKTLLRCFIIMFGLYLISHGLGLWFPTIDNAYRTKHTRSKFNSTVCDLLNEFSGNNKLCDDTIHSYTDLIILGVAYTAGYITQGILTMFVKRKIIFILLLVTSSICGYCLSFVINPLTIASLFAAFLMPSGVAIPIFDSVLADSVPTHLRTKAMSVAAIFGRLGAVVGSHMLALLLHTYCLWALNTFAVFITFCALLSFTVSM